MEMDLQRFIRIVWKRRWHVVILAAGAIVATWVGSRLTQPVYQANARVLIVVPISDGAPFPDRIVMDCVELLKSRSLREDMQRMLASEAQMKHDQLVRSIGVQAVPGTDVISVSVDSTDPRVAARAANALIKALFARLGGRASLSSTSSGGVQPSAIPDEHLPGGSIQIRNVEAHVVDWASVPRSPIKPRTRFNMEMAAILSVIAGCGLALLMEYFSVPVKKRDREFRTS